jgi:probable phosphoglycerate mutase
MKMIFARHGEGQANLAHKIANRGLRYGLTTLGRRQAVALAERLREFPIQIIYTSPVLRAIETSVLLAERLEVPYEVAEALREYDCGVAEGRSDPAAWRLWQDLFEAWTIQRRWEARIDGGESFFQVRDRFVPFIEQVVDHYRGSESAVVCVAHGGIFWTMLPLVLNIDKAESFSRLNFDYTSFLVAEENCGKLVIVNQDGGAPQND